MFVHPEIFLTMASLLIMNGMASNPSLANKTEFHWTNALTHLDWDFFLPINTYATSLIECSSIAMATKGLSSKLFIPLDSFSTYVNLANAYVFDQSKKSCEIATISYLREAEPNFVPKVHQ